MTDTAPPSEKKAKRKCSPAQRAALRKGRATMKANAKARRQALAAATREAKLLEKIAEGETSARPRSTSKSCLQERADDHLLSRALIGDGDLPSWLRD